MAIIDVILTSYNRTTLLKQAIDSVLNQSLQDFILHIIDDGSKQPTKDIINSYVSDCNKIVYYQTNKKDKDRYKVCDYAQNINNVIKKSTSEYISYLTCDDIYYNNHLEACVEYLKNNTDVGIVFTDQCVVNYNDTTEDITKGFYRICSDVVDRAACVVDHNQVVMRRSVIDKAGYWVEDASVYGAGDAAYWNKLNDAGFRFYRVPVLGTEHRLHKNSVQSLG